MIQYPLFFQVQAEGSAGIQSDWSVGAGEHRLRCSIPPEFEGPGGGFSPEDLFALALTNCFVATFKVYAEKSKLVFSEVRARAELQVDLDGGSQPVMKSLRVVAVISGATDLDRCRRIAERAFRSGFILNSVKTETHLEVEVTP